MLSLFDSHAHYDDERFRTEFEGGTFGAVEAVNSDGICGIINVGANLKSSQSSVELAEKYDFIYAAVGIHPSDAQELGGTALKSAMESLHSIAVSAPCGKVVAIGEIGLDYHYDGTDKECQALYFHAQLELAETLGLPVIIHTRDAMGDTLDILAKHPNVTGVMHSFSGSAEVARQLTAKGWYISFSGPLTYKNSAKVKEAAGAVPADRILVETDCPYLPPVPHRGELNHSGYLHFTCEKLAEIRGLSAEDMAEITVQNTKNLFSIK